MTEPAEVTCLELADPADLAPADGTDGSVTVYPDGPLLIRGGVRIQRPDGAEIPNVRNTVALCRCGKSSLKPWCDGTHKIARFAAP